MSEIEHIPKNALFGKYVIGRLLGCGAFAKVYHARNFRTGISVAIKVINKKKLSPALISNVKREISIMSRLNHPYIVKLHEVCATKTKIYVVMELVKGGELFAKVSKGRFTEDLSRKYFQQLISAIGYCHSRGIFHRDLKPENLLLDDVNGNLKVSDFGLSALTDQIRSDGMLHTLCGTPAYVAPEILTKKGYDGAKVDVWSCGVILFVMNAGYLPFNDPNLMAMYKKIYKGEFKCPKYMSSEMKRLVSRLLDTNPETRITIDEILKDPWFKKGYNEPKFHEEQAKDDDPRVTSSMKLNAFDLISFSSGLDLSGLLDESYDYGERFVLRESSPEKLVGKVEEVGKGEKLRVKQRRKEWGGLELEGKDGNSGVAVEVYRLTDELVVVEAKRTGSDTQWYKEFWNNKMRPALLEIRQET